MAEKEEAEIIIGTYEDFVVGYRLNFGRIKKTKDSVDCDQSFAVRSHSGSVTCLAVSSSGNFAISAGYDEMVNLFSLKKRKLLQTFEGSVKCATFVGDSHLICGSEDSNIHIYELKKNSLDLVKTLKGHKMAITSLSVHPSGKVLLSISKDDTMRTWNLIKGRCAFVTHTRSQAHLVKWSLSGEEFLIAADKEIYLYNNSGNLEHNLKLEKRINSIEFITKSIFLVAIDSGQLEFFDRNKGVSMFKFEAHDARIKSVKLFSGAESSAVRFATASSDGMVKIWESERPGLVKPRELTNFDTGARLTCMVTTSPEAT